MMPGDEYTHLFTGLTAAYVGDFWCGRNLHIFRKSNGKLMIIPKVILGAFWEAS